MDSKTLEKVANTLSNGCSFITVESSVVVALTGGKKNEHQGRIIKRSKVRCLIYSKSGYEKRMRKLTGDETFVSGKRRPWGIRREGVPLIDHKGKLYLEVIALDTLSVEYLLDGEVIPVDNIIGMKPKREGVDTGLRVFESSSIDGINAFKARYI